MIVALANNEPEIASNPAVVTTLHTIVITTTYVEWEPRPDSSYLDTFLLLVPY